MSSLTPEAYEPFRSFPLSRPARRKWLHPWSASSFRMPRGVAVIDEQGHESDLRRIYDAGLFAGRLGNGPRQRYRLRARYGECQLEIEESYRFPPKILISTCSAKERICISTKSWVPIRWCSTAWRAWPLSSLHRGWRFQSLVWTTPRHGPVMDERSAFHLDAGNMQTAVREVHRSPKGYPYRALLVTGRAKFSCACGTPHGARRAGDPQI